MGGDVATHRCQGREADASAVSSDSAVLPSGHDAHSAPRPKPSIHSINSNMQQTVNISPEFPGTIARWPLQDGLWGVPAYVPPASRAPRLPIDDLAYLSSGRSFLLTSHNPTCNNDLVPASSPRGKPELFFRPLPWESCRVRAVPPIGLGDGAQVSVAPRLPMASVTSARAMKQQEPLCRCETARCASASKIRAAAGADFGQLLIDASVAKFCQLPPKGQAPGSHLYPPTATTSPTCI